jgi:hypothetical protein
MYLAKVKDAERTMSGVHDARTNYGQLMVQRCFHTLSARPLQPHPPLPSAVCAPAHHPPPTAAIQARVKESEQTEQKINATRDEYRLPPSRASLLWFIIADLVLLDPMYQYSLAYFCTLFKQCIASTPACSTLAARLENLVTGMTSFMYRMVSEGICTAPVCTAADRTSLSVVDALPVALAMALHHPPTSPAPTECCSVMVDRSSKNHPQAWDNHDSCLSGVFASVLLQVCRGLFEAHKQVFSLLIAATIQREAGEITQLEWDFFLRDPSTLSTSSRTRDPSSSGAVQHAAAAGAVSPPPWMPSSTWGALQVLAGRVPAVAGLLTAVAADPGAWQGRLQGDCPPLTARSRVSGLSLEASAQSSSSLDDLATAWGAQHPLTDFQKVLLVKVRCWHPQSLIAHMTSRIVCGCMPGSGWGQALTTHARAPSIHQPGQHVLS